MGRHLRSTGRQWRTAQPPLSLLLSWAVHPLRGWRGIPSGQLPVPIPVPTADDPTKRIAALCLHTREHTPQFLVMLGATHRLVMATLSSLAGWATAAAPAAPSLRTPPHDVAGLADPSIPHTSRRETASRIRAVNGPQCATPYVVAPFDLDFHANDLVSCYAVTFDLRCVAGRVEGSGQGATLVFSSYPSLGASYLICPLLFLFSFYYDKKHRFGLVCCLIDLVCLCPASNGDTCSRLRCAGIPPSH